MILTLLEMLNSHLASTFFPTVDSENNFICLMYAFENH